MSRASRSLRRSAVILCLVLLLGTAGWVLLIRGLDRLFSSPNLEASLEPLKITIKKAASDFVVVRHGKTAPFLPPAGGYLIAYENDPEGFRADAKVFDTWFNATRLAAQVLDRDTDRNWVRSSSEIDYLKPEDRLDAWGHAFCLLRRENTLLVISAGSAAPSTPLCRDIHMEARELAQLPHGKLLESPSRTFVLVLDKNRLQTSKPAPLPTFVPLCFCRPHLRN